MFLHKLKLVQYLDLKGVEKIFVVQGALFIGAVYYYFLYYNYSVCALARLLAFMGY